MAIHAMFPACPLPSQQLGNLAWEKLPMHSISTFPQLESSTWVKLLSPPTVFSFDEAQILCQYSDEAWLAWVPDYGEILLTIDEFYLE